MADSRIAVVTGANRGLGLAIGIYSQFLHDSLRPLPLPPLFRYLFYLPLTLLCSVRNLALQYATSYLNENKPLPLTIYLTSRSPSAGQKAVENLESDPQLLSAKALSAQGGSTTIKSAKLDVTSSSSIKDLAKFLGTTHPQGIDVLVNNAGAPSTQAFDIEIVKDTTSVNYYGTVNVMMTLLPLLQSKAKGEHRKGRIVNIASLAGQLTKDYPEELRQEFLRAARNSVKDCTLLMDRFVKDVEESKVDDMGWPNKAYFISKAGVIAATKAAANENQGNDQQNEKANVLINTCDPGLIKTDINYIKGEKSPDQGAQTPVMLALKDINDRSGGFWADENEISWVINDRD